MKRTYRRHKLKITTQTLAAYKAARIRELIRRGRPVPSTLLPNEPSELSRRRDNLDQESPFDSTEASR